MLSEKCEPVGMFAFCCAKQGNKPGAELKQVWFFL